MEVRTGLLLRSITTLLYYSTPLFVLPHTIKSTFSLFERFDQRYKSEGAPGRDIRKARLHRKSSVCLNKVFKVLALCFDALAHKLGPGVWIHEFIQVHRMEFTIRGTFFTLSCAAILLFVCSLRTLTCSL